MPDVNFGGTNFLSSYTDEYVYSNGIGLPTGRAMANGSKACLITALRGYVAGRGATRTIGMRLGSAVCSNFSVGAAGAASSTGFRSCSNWLVAGGSAQFRYDLSGSTYFGRSSSGSATTSYSTGFGTLGGSYRYVQGPTAPLSVVVEPMDDPTQLDVAWLPPSDDGDTSITGYRVEWSTSSNFSGASSTTTSNTFITLTGLTPGTRYYVRVSALNAVTSAASTWGVYSSSANALTRSGGQIRVDGDWVPRRRQIRDGGAWKPVTRRVRVGGAWVPVR